MTIRILTPALALILTVPVVNAEDAPVEDPWSGSIELGYLQSSGNTESENFYGSAKVVYMRDRWKHEAKAASKFSEEEGETTAESYNASLKTDYNFTKHDYVFVALGFDSDRFAGYARRYSESVGYGRRLFNTKTQMLNLEIGAGARQTRRTDKSRENEAIVRGFGQYIYKFSTASEFRQSVLVESGEENTYGESVSELRMPLVANVSVNLSYTLKHNSSVPAGNVHTDSYLAVTVGYAF